MWISEGDMFIDNPEMAIRTRFFGAREFRGGGGGVILFWVR